MSFLRAGGAAGFRAGRAVTPVAARFKSSISRVPGDPPVKTSPSAAPAVPLKGSSLISEETPAEAMTRHQPDYAATIDHGTS